MILFLGYDKSKTYLIDYLESLGFDVVHKDSKVSLTTDSGFDYVISFGYKHIIKKDFIEHYQNRIINLHISYLPYNRGAHPNFWSFYDKTPSGVTIHYIDEGLDTGDILCQRKIDFDIDKLSFKETYDILINEIQTLFVKNFINIYHNKITPIKQSSHYTYHKSSDLPKNIDWDKNIKKYLNSMKRDPLEIIDEIQKIRSKNNVNWMDILRLAFKHAPNEAKKIMININSHDDQISKLLKELSDD